jgi:hypothetical protein
MPTRPAHLLRAAAANAAPALRRRLVCGAAAGCAAGGAAPAPGPRLLVLVAALLPGAARGVQLQNRTRGRRARGAAATRRSARVLPPVPAAAAAARGRAAALLRCCCCGGRRCAWLLLLLLLLLALLLACADVSKLCLHVRVALQPLAGQQRLQGCRRLGGGGRRRAAPAVGPLALHRQTSQRKVHSKPGTPTRCVSVRRHMDCTGGHGWGMLASTDAAVGAI